jgi:FkbM family methyltransferase
VQLVGNIYIPDGDQHFVKLGADIEHYQEPQRIKAFEYVTTWDCAVDLGAHVGIFSRHFARRFEQVIAFEPTPETRMCLDRNVPANVLIVPYACGDREDNVLFRRHLKNSGGSEIASDSRPDSGAFKHYTVRMITLDSLNLQGVGLVKIDIQGAEPLALRGAAETLRRCKPVVLIEEKPFGGKGASGSVKHIEESRDILFSYGYREGEKIGADRIYLCGSRRD